MFNFELTDAMNPTGYRESQISISNDGLRIYATHVQGPAFGIMGSVAAELYENIDGRLESVSSISTDPSFPNVLSGVAGPLFDRFLLLVDDGISLGQVRLYDADFQIVATRDLPGYAVETKSLNVSKYGFSQDSRIVVISYVNNVSDARGVKTILRVLDGSTLSNLTTLTFQGFTLGASCFTLWQPLNEQQRKRNVYIAFGMSRGILNSSSQLIAKPPAVVQVYRLHKRRLILVDETPTPHLAHVVPFLTRQRSRTLLSVTTPLVVSPGETSVFTQTEVSRTFLPRDNNNFRLYEFNGHSLDVVLSKHFDSFLYDVAFYPDRKYIVLTMRSGSSEGLNVSPYIFMAYELVRYQIFQRTTTNDTVTKSFYPRKVIETKPASDPFVAPASYPLVEFSRNGRWLIVGGSGHNSTVSTLNLYRVEIPNESDSDSEEEEKNNRSRFPREERSPTSRMEEEMTQESQSESSQVDKALRLKKLMQMQTTIDTTSKIGRHDTKLNLMTRSHPLENHHHSHYYRKLNPSCSECRENIKRMLQMLETSDMADETSETSIDDTPDKADIIDLMSSNNSAPNLTKPSDNIGSTSDVQTVTIGQTLHKD